MYNVQMDLPPKNQGAAPQDLCDKPLGAADYLAIGQAFHTIFIADIPRLTMQDL